MDLLESEPVSGSGSPIQISCIEHSLGDTQIAVFAPDDYYWFDTPLLVTFASDKPLISFCNVSYDSIIWSSP